MPNPSIPCPGSPDITTLSYSVLFDISGAIPNIILTNGSTVVNANRLTWWYVITTPSGTPIHVGSLTSPDVVNVAWATLQIPPNSWPLLFGNGPCAQVEFASAKPYNCTLFVKDSIGGIYSLGIQQAITRPNGNTENSCGNFGVAVAAVEVKCYTNPGIVFCSDSTNYTYNNVVTPIVNSMVNSWILTYPPDANGNQPANGTATNTPYVNFPVGYNGDGYVLFLNDYASYDMGNGASIKVQYKAINPNSGTAGLPFAVLCNIDLCQLQCQMQAFYDVSKKSCNTVENSEWAYKKTDINYLFSQAILGIIQPLCKIDVAAMVLEIRKIIGAIGNNCNCGCTDTGVNFNYPTGASSGTSGCCPVSVKVIDRTTGLAPASCPLSYFPCQVMDPTNTTSVGNANNVNDLVAILNATTSWEAYGIAFAEGNCKIGWFPVNPATTPPNVYINPGAVVIPPSGYVDPIQQIGTSSPPAGCPMGDPYPVKVYDPTAAMVIGIANTIADVVSILNSYIGWSVYGVASVQDNCHVQFNLANPSDVPPVIKVDSNVTGSGCQSNSSNFLIYMIDPCKPDAPITASSFPCNIIVDWGFGPEIAGNATNFADVITIINGMSDKPTQITITVGSAPFTINIINSNCTTYPHTPVITCNAGSNSFILFGANSTNQTPLSNPATQNGVIVLGVANSSDVGRIAGATANKHMWHTIKIGNYVIVAEGDTGKIYFYDVADALSPTLARTIQLNDTGSGLCFSGHPYSVNWESQSPTRLEPSFYSLYFPTDYYALMNLNSIIVSEGTTGSLWVVDFYGPGTGVVASDTNVKLLGKCPRVFAFAGGTTAGVGAFFTQDGDLEQAAGLSSTVPVGYAVSAIYTAPSTFTYNEFEIFSNNFERVYALSYDGTQYFYWTGQYGSVAISTGLGDPYVVNPYIFGGGPGEYQFLYRLNTACFAGNLYFCALELQVGMSPPAYAEMLKVTTASLLALTPVVTPVPGAPSSSTGAAVFNALPLGNCLMVLTSPSLEVDILTTAGQPVERILLSQNGQIYNVVALPNYETYAPNSFINP